MRKNVYKVTLVGLKTLIFKKKICPNCGSQNLKRYTESVYRGRERCSDSKLNLMYEDVYSSTLIYECQTCKRKYTLEGLRDSTEYLGTDQLIESDIGKSEKTIEIRQAENVQNKSMMRKFGNLWGVIAMLIVIITAVQEKEALIVLISAPFILIVYFAFRFFTK